MSGAKLLIPRLSHNALKTQGVSEIKVGKVSAMPVSADSKNGGNYSLGEGARRQHGNDVDHTVRARWPVDDRVDARPICRVIWLQPQSGCRTICRCVDCRAIVLATAGTTSTPRRKLRPRSFCSSRMPMGVCRQTRSSRWRELFPERLTHATTPDQTLNEPHTRP
jgi:hypothetical protein